MYEIIKIFCTQMCKKKPFKFALKMQKTRKKNMQNLFAVILTNQLIL